MDRLCIFLALCSLCACEVTIISEPIPGQEYVFVQTSQSGARPITRKDKNVDAADRPFETAHKFPEGLTFKVEDEAAPLLLKEKLYKEEKEIKHSKSGKVKRQAIPGVIKIDPLKLIEKYNDDDETVDAKANKKFDKKSEIIKEMASTTKAPAKAPTTKTPARTTKAPASPVATSKRPRIRSRTKKEAPVATTPNSVLTTGAPATPRTLHIRDTAAVKDVKPENKRSKIQIKKGPNGQEYEYEYVYYYYDDDEDVSGKSKVSNSHDGPARNSITGRGRSTTTAHPEPAANEVVPRGTRGRGRQLSHEVPEEKVPEEKLPLNTRFPPRSRNINTTPASAEEEEAKTQKNFRGRGKPAQDNAADETQVSGRGRNRANVRRPSLDLVDSASFNTHSSNDPAIEPYKEPKARGEKPQNGPSFPTELPEGPVRFLGATPNEKMDVQELKSRLAENEETSTADGESVSVTTEEIGTTESTGMNKVALDLYAILQGTQKLSGESEDGVTESDLTTTESADTTDETTTEAATTEEITTPTTTTTTTTTTQAPTTTTTPEPVTGRGKFRGGRPGGNRFKSSPSSTTSAPEPSSEKPKGRFGRPGFGSRPRPGARATTEAAETEVAKEEAKPVSNARPSTGGSRNRFSGRGRTTPSTTSAPESSDSTTAFSRPGLSRPRPGSFNLRRRGGATTTTTKEPAEESGDDSPSHEEPSSTTAKPSIRSRVNGNLARPLRPGARINLAARGRPGAATTSTTVVPEAAGEESTPEEVVQPAEETGETTPANVGSKNSLTNLRNRPRLTVNPIGRPKQPASNPVQVRRNNPLLRKKPVVNAEPSEAPTEPAAESATEAVGEEEAPSEAPSSTTEEPRGLNKLLAGRRRLVRPVAHN